MSVIHKYVESCYETRLESDVTEIACPSSIRPEIMQTADSGRSRINGFIYFPYHTSTCAIVLP